jgi:hypothetical protein
MQNDHKLPPDNIRMKSSSKKRNRTYRTHAQTITTSTAYLVLCTNKQHYSETIAQLKIKDQWHGSIERALCTYRSWGGMDLGEEEDGVCFSSAVTSRSKEPEQFETPLVSCK